MKETHSICFKDTRTTTTITCGASNMYSCTIQCIPPHRFATSCQTLFIATKLQSVHTQIQESTRKILWMKSHAYRMKNMCIFFRKSKQTGNHFVQSFFLSLFLSPIEDKKATYVKKKERRVNRWWMKKLSGLFFFWKVVNFMQPVLVDENIVINTNWIDRDRREEKMVNT